MGIKQHFYQVQVIIWMTLIFIWTSKRLLDNQTGKLGKVGVHLGKLSPNIEFIIGLV